MTRQSSNDDRRLCASGGRRRPVEWSTAVCIFWTGVGLCMLSQSASAARQCAPREACRVVEYHPIIKDDSSGLRGLEVQSSGNPPANEMDYGDGLANEVPTIPYDETSYTVDSTHLCDCPHDFECPGENNTDAERSVRLDSFVALKLCTPKQRFPVCRDFRRAVVRLFKEFEEGDEQRNHVVAPEYAAQTHDMHYVKAQMYCRCDSAHFGKSRNVEIWKQGTQHAIPYLCSRHRR